MLVQLALLFNVTCVGVIGASHKREILEELGCDCIIDKSKDNLWEKVETEATTREKKKRKKGGGREGGLLTGLIFFASSFFCVSFSLSFYN